MSFNQQEELGGIPAARRGSNVVWGTVITVWLGFTAFLAVLFIPSSFSEPGALTLSALVMALGIAAVPLARAISSQSNLPLLRMEALLSAALIYWVYLDVIQESYPILGVSDTAIQLVFVYGSMFVIALWIGVFASRERLANFLIGSVSPLTPTIIFCVAVASFLLGIFPYLYFADFSPGAIINAFYLDRWSAPWAREALGDERAFVLHLAYFGFFVPALTVLYADRTDWWRPFTLILVVLSAVVILLLAQSGGRRTVGGIVMASVICWIILNHGASLRRQMTMVVGASSALLVGLQYMLYTRGEGLFWSSDEYSSAFSLDYLRVDDNFFRTAQVIDLIPAEHPFVPWEFLSYVLVFPVPRVFWEGKPTGPGFDLAQAVGLEGVSLSMSILGELHVIYGMPAVWLGGFALGWISSKLNFLIELSIKNRNPMTYALLVMAFFNGIRSLFDIVLGLFAVGAWWVVVYMMIRPASPRSSRGSR